MPADKLSLRETLLKRSSKALGIDTSYFFGNSFLLVLNQVFGALKAFLVSLLFANLAPKELFGEYVFVSALLSIAYLFAFPGMQVAIVQAIAKNKDGTFMLALKEIYKWSWLGSLFLVGSALYSYVQHDSFSIALICIVLAVLFPPFSVSGLFRGYYVGRKQFTTYFYISSLLIFLSLVMIGAVLLWYQDLFLLIVPFVVAQALIGAYLNHIAIPRVIRSKASVPKNISFGKKISIAELIYSLILKLDRPIVAILGFEQLAIYSIITLLPNQPKIMFSSLKPLYLPKLAEVKIRRKDFLLHIFKFFIMAIGIIALYSIVARFLFITFYPEYVDYTWLSVLFAISIVNIPRPLIMAVFQHRLSHRKINALNGSAAIVSIVSLLALVQFGLLGVVIARIIGRFYEVGSALVVFLYASK
ncbi:MAG: oligosaccharide flippase family protein [Candidatus Woesearchaeota archaeon]|nr:MAG: oligosaccharide flippase family protein [Candidatus Woesearchaeota archaeon]